MSSGDKIYILIVEDNEDYIFFIKKILQSEKYSVKSISNGAEALNYLSAENVPESIVLLDNLLPEMNGLEILEKLQDKKHNYAFIFLTVDSQIETIVKAMKIGALDFIVKSSNLKIELPEKIEKVYEIYKNRLEHEKRSEELLIAKETAELNNKRLESLLKISQFPVNSSQELFDFALEEAISITNSKIGFFAFFQEKTEELILTTESKNVMLECNVENRPTVYQLDDAGIWGEVVRQRKAIVLNSFQTENPYKKGIHEGHVKFYKYLSIPVIFDKKIVAVASIANKETDYNDLDIRQMTLLMDNVWKRYERISLVDNLKVANATKDKFFSILAHDLRSPFNSMLGFSNMLNKNFDKYDSEKKKKFISIINDGLRRELKLLDNLLSWSRSQKGIIEFNPERINLSASTDEIIELFIQTANNKEIELKNSISENVFVTADQDMLSTIIRNLLSNAIKYTPKGGEIDIYALMKRTVFEIVIRDSGVGISKENQLKLFDISDSSSTKGTKNETGTGLGLVLCKEFVEKHGGKIWVISETGQGSAFHFTIPFKLKNI